MQRNVYFYVIKVYFGYFLLGSQDIDMNRFYLYLSITVLIRNYEESVKLLNIKATEKSVYKKEKKYIDRAFILA